MSRRNLWDVLQNTEINPIKEVLKIEKLFSRTEIFINEFEFKTIEDYIDSRYFSSWKYRGTCLDISDFRKSKKILTTQRIDGYANISIEDMFLYFEFIINMLYLIKEFDGNLADYYILIQENIDFILEHYNQKSFSHKEEDIFIIVEKSEKATSVSELYPEIAIKVIEYNRFSLKGNLQRKKELLLAIAHKFEGVKKQLKQVNPALCDDITNLLNNINIRHNNEDKVKNISDEDLEKWYDRIYDMLLLALLYVDYAEYIGGIRDLHKTLKVK